MVTPKEHIIMATPSRSKRVIYAALAGLGITAGAAAISAAATSTTTPTTPPPAHQAPAQPDTQSSGDSPDYRGSVTVPQVPDTSKSADDEAADTAALAHLAKVTPEQAASAATASVPGSAGKVQLEDENGNVVYGVEVTTANGSRVDVKVDAGNGAVLHQESDDESGHETGDNTKESTDSAESSSADAGVTTRN